jgi:hypothetical protein
MVGVRILAARSSSRVTTSGVPSTVPCVRSGAAWKFRPAAHRSLCVLLVMQGSLQRGGGGVVKSPCARSSDLAHSHVESRLGVLHILRIA